MTLLELVVAVVITGVMATAGGAAFGTIIDERRTLLEATVHVERAAALRTQLQDWIGSGTIERQVGGVRLGGATFTAGAVVTRRRAGGRDSLPGGVAAALAAGDEVRFTTGALAEGGSAATVARLFVDGDANSPERGLVLEYQAAPQAPLARRTLDSTITELHVEVLDRVTRRWVPDREAVGVQRAALRLWFTVGTPADTPRLLRLPMLFVLPGVPGAPDVPPDALTDMLSEAP